MSAAIQTEIPVAIDSNINPESFKAASIDYEECKKLTYLQPVFLVYCGQTKKFFCSKITSKAGVLDYPTNKIIQ